MMKTFKQFILESPAPLDLGAPAHVEPAPVNIEDLIQQVNVAIKDPSAHREAIPGLLDGIKAHIEKLQNTPDPDVGSKGVDKLGRARMDYERSLQKLTAKWISLNRAYNAHGAMEEADSEQLNYETKYLAKETQKLMYECQKNGLFSNNRPSRRRR
jgi:hypothetical protein